jgi:hypothetical protein
MEDLIVFPIVAIVSMIISNLLIFPKREEALSVLGALFATAFMWIAYSSRIDFSSLWLAVATITAFLTVMPIGMIAVKIAEKKALKAYWGLSLFFYISATISIASATFQFLAIESITYLPF